MMRPGGVRQFYQVLLHRSRDFHLRQFLSGVQQLCRGDNRFSLFRNSCPGQQCQFLFLIRIAQRKAQQKAIQLSLGKRKRPLHLHRILRSNDEERRLQRIGHAVCGHLAFLHALQQGRLGAWRSTVDLIRQKDLGEHCTFPKHEFAGFRVGDADTYQVGGQQIRRELDAVKAGIQSVCQTPGKGSLSCAGNVIQQHMTAAQQRSQHLINNILFAVDVRGYGIPEQCGNGFDL